MVISQVVPAPMHDVRAACLAIKVAYLPLFAIESIVLKGGTHLIFVPSGNAVHPES